MAGCFGLSEDHHDRRVTPGRLTESHLCVDVFELYREGLLVPGASARLETPYGSHRLVHEASKIWIDDQAVVIGSHPVLPQKVFICPVCQQIRYKLFNVGGRWACYRDHQLTHASRHLLRMVPAWHRLARLRRKIGAPLVPFSEIEPRPLRQRRYWRIVLEIRQLEAGLVGHIREDVADVLQKRHDRGRGKRNRSGSREPDVG